MIARIGELYAQISKAQAELEEIRQNCKHDQGHRIASYMWRIGSIYPSRMCLVCDKAIDGITEEEVNKFKDEEEARNKAWRKANGIPEVNYGPVVTVTSEET